jgi:hypothetical protein
MGGKSHTWAPLITDLQDYPNPPAPPQNVKLYHLYAYTWGRGRGGRNINLKCR